MYQFKSLAAMIIMLIGVSGNACMCSNPPPSTHNPEAFRVWLPAYDKHPTLSNVRDVAIAQDGSIYTVMSNNVKKLDSSGNLLIEWGTGGTGDGEFSGPAGITIDSSGDLYVVDGGNHRIQKFSSTGTFLAKWGSEGNGDGEFKFPSEITIDSSGNLYVTDSGNDRIQKFSSTGTLLDKWGGTGSGNGEFSYPSDITIDSSGNFYVADTYNHRIQKFKSDGTFLDKWGGTGSEFDGSGSGNGEFLSPGGVTIDSSDNLYVTDSGNNRIQKFSSTGTFLDKWGGTGSGYNGSGSGDGEFNYPSDIAIDSSGNLYVADGGNSRIQKFSSSVTFIAKWGNSGNGDGEFNYPEAITTNRSGNFYVADSGNNRIQKFKSDGTFLRKWGGTGSGHNGSGSGDGEFNHPSGIAADRSGNFYVVDSGNNRIQKFSSSGTLLKKWGSMGTGDGEFDGPNDITIDSSGNIYVVDTFNNRIQKFSSDGTYITKWGGTGSEWNGSGSGDGEFNQPYGITIDSSGNIYVVDTFNNRIQKFSSDGTYITKWGSLGIGYGEMDYPRDIAADSNGNIYVVDRYSIHKFDSSGTFITRWVNIGSANGQFIYPRGITINSSGNIYVADPSNNRIQKKQEQTSGFLSPIYYLLGM